MDRMGARLPLVVGPLLVAVAFVLFWLLPGVNSGYWSSILPPIVVLGLGMALVVAPLTTTVMASVPDPLAGTASGVNNAVSRVVGLLAVAVYGVVMVAVFSTHLQTGLGDLDVTPAQREEILAARTDLAELEPPGSLDEGTAEALTGLVHASFLSGFRVMALAMASLAVVGSGVAWFTIRGPGTGPARDEGP